MYFFFFHLLWNSKQFTTYGKIMQDFACEWCNQATSMFGVTQADENVSMFIAMNWIKFKFKNRWRDPECKRNLNIFRRREIPLLAHQLLQYLYFSVLYSSALYRCMFTRSHLITCSVSHSCRHLLASRDEGFTLIDVGVFTSLDGFVEPSPHLLLGSVKKTFILDGSGICKMFGDVTLVTVSEHLNFFSSAQPKKLYLSTSH